MMTKPDETTERKQQREDPGWGPMLRVLRICAGLLTAYAFYHGYSSPEHIFGTEHDISFGLQLLAGVLVAFIPCLLFAATFARSWK